MFVKKAILQLTIQKAHRASNENQLAENFGDRCSCLYLCVMRHAIGTP